MSSILVLWNALVTLTAIITIVATGLGLMVGAVEVSRAIQRIAIALACMILLLMLPPIIVGIWHSLSIWQQFGIATLAGLTGYFALAGLRKHPQKKTHNFR